MNARHHSNLVAKAARLVNENKCREIASASEAYWLGVVEGDHGSYLTTFVYRDAVPSGVGVVSTSACSCASGQHHQLCSHVIAAQSLVPVDQDALWARLGA